MSPEQAQCKPVGPTSDVFSLGSVIAFAATGRALFGGGLPVTQMYRVINDQPDLTSIAGPLRGLVGECLAKNPADRPSLDELLDAITTGSETFSAASPSSFWPRPLAAYIRARNDVTNPRRAVEALSAPVAQAPVKNEGPAGPSAPADAAAPQPGPGASNEAPVHADATEPSEHPAAGLSVPARAADNQAQASSTDELTPGEPLPPGIAVTPEPAAGSLSGPHRPDWPKRPHWPQKGSSQPRTSPQPSRSHHVPARCRHRRRASVS